MAVVQTSLVGARVVLLRMRIHRGGGCAARNNSLPMCEWTGPRRWWQHQAAGSSRVVWDLPARRSCSPAHGCKAAPTGRGGPGEPGVRGRDVACGCGDAAMYGTTSLTVVDAKLLLVICMDANTRSGL
jgi:hypothetical protein